MFAIQRIKIYIIRLFSQERIIQEIRKMKKTLSAALIILAAVMVSAAPSKFTRKELPRMFNRDRVPDFL